MAWKHNGRTIQTGRSWISDNNTKYPRQWNNLTDAEKKSAGLVWEDDPVEETYDNRFYWAKDVAKKLDDVNVVDADGKAVNDPLTGKQKVDSGLKTIWVAKTKATGNNKLVDTDWYVTRKAESSTAIPSDISTYRSAVRTATATIEKKITDCSDLAAFIALFDTPVDSDNQPTGKAPIYDFPDEV
tara:strand:- start:113 stop:667 length:555 start_codon:yes stop_codon:yes gene_type:complete